MERLRVARAARSALAALLALGLLLVPATAAPAAPRQAHADLPLVDAAGWHGRAIQRPHGHTAVRTTSGAPPAGWSAGPVALGTGSTRAGGSRRVREVQRRLRRLGYAAGPEDGIYGRRTRAAVTWFQRKHGLRPDGAASLTTVQHLRERTGAARRDRGAGTAPQTIPAASTPGAPERPAGSAAIGEARVIRTASVRADEVPWAIAAALALAGVVLLGLGLAVRRRSRRRLDRHRPLVTSPHRPPEEPTGASRRPRALGYVRLAPGAPSASFHAQAAAIETGCIARGLALVSLVSDLEPHRRTAGRPPALAFALERLESGDADRLVVSRLDHLAPTREELHALLESLAVRRAGLVVLDRDLDTAGLPGSAASAALLGRVPGRSPAPWDPAAGPAVAAHIASMLDEGASHEEVVAALNAEPVPPPQGGRWSRSGVEAAVRRRPHPDRGERTDA